MDVDLLRHFAYVEEGGGGSVGDDLDGFRVRQRLVVGRLRGLHVHVGGEEDGLGLRHAVGRDVYNVEPGNQVVVRRRCVLADEADVVGEASEQGKLPAGQAHGVLLLLDEGEAAVPLGVLLPLLEERVEAPGGVDAGQLPVGLVGLLNGRAQVGPGHRVASTELFLRHGEEDRRGAPGGGEVGRRRLHLHPTFLGVDGQLLHLPQVHDEPGREERHGEDEGEDALVRNADRGLEAGDVCRLRHGQLQSLFLRCRLQTLQLLPPRHVVDEADVDAAVAGVVDDGGEVSDEDVEFCGEGLGEVGEAGEVGLLGGELG